jgi:hypothetical protein
MANRINPRQEPMPWGTGQLGLRPRSNGTGRQKTLSDHARSAAVSGRLRRYQAKVGRTVAVIMPEGNNDPLLWTAPNYCNDYGFPVGVKKGGAWYHPSGTAWGPDVAALLEAAPFTGGLGT